jgi:hypothetical protein
MVPAAGFPELELACTCAQLDGGRDDSLAAFWGRSAG